MCFKDCLPVTKTTCCQRLVPVAALLPLTMASNWESFADDQFYDDLTLKFTKTLELIPGVENIIVDKRTGCEKGSVLSWEQRQCCMLPLDLKNFYLSVDGFNLTYDYKYAGEALPAGRLNINSLGDLRRYCGYTNEMVSDSPSLRDLDIINMQVRKPSFGPNCKIFELDHVENVYSVCLVYNDVSSTQSIWLLDRSLDWHKLADNFSQYFRMMLYHHGLPEWQYKKVGLGLSPLSEQLMIAIAPHLIALETEKKVICRHVQTQIDPYLFKSKHKPSKKNKEKKKIFKC